MNSSDLSKLFQSAEELIEPEEAIVTGKVEIVQCLLNYYVFKASFCKKKKLREVFD